jgi:plasmid stability protein
MPQDEELQVRALVEILGRHEEARAHASSLEAAARAWLAAGFDDPEEVSEWLDARCFEATAAQALERAGLTPEQAALRTTAGARPYEETIGFKFARGDMSLDEARRIATSEFWNS